tara:strand:+ start:556 stop:756 length:201 start_codon:yes stop_codon:yes gene_type:complete
MNNMNKKEIINKLSEFDWTYSRSDDSRVILASENYLDYLQNEAEKIMTTKEYVELFNKAIEDGGKI